MITIPTFHYVKVLLNNSNNFTFTSTVLIICFINMQCHISLWDVVYKPVLFDVFNVNNDFCLSWCLLNSLSQECLLIRFTTLFTVIRLLKTQNDWKQRQRLLKPCNHSHHHHDIGINFVISATASRRQIDEIHAGVHENMWFARRLSQNRLLLKLFSVVEKLSTAKSTWWKLFQLISFLKDIIIRIVCSIGLRLTYSFTLSVHFLPTFFQ